MSAKEKQVVEIQGKLEDITECPICKETYKEPKILPCIHTFCLICLQKTGLKTSNCPWDLASCPVCRKEFIVPENGFVGLQRNFFMERLIEMKSILNPSSTRVLCDACQEDFFFDVDIAPAAIYCADCNQRMCEECCIHHRKFKATKNHRMLQLNGAQTNIPTIVNPYVCGKHGNKPLEIYCSNCREAICALCFFDYHKTHETSPVVNVSPDFRRVIKENSDGMLRFILDLKKKIMEKVNDEAVFARKVASVESEIKTARQNLQEYTEKHCDSLLQELSSIRHEKYKKRESQLSDIETVLASLVSYQSYCTQLTTIGPDVDICRAVHSLNRRAAELKQHYESLSLEPLPNICLKKPECHFVFFRAGNNIIGNIEEHGDNKTSKVEDARSFSDKMSSFVDEFFYILDKTSSYVSSNEMKDNSEEEQKNEDKETKRNVIVEVFENTVRDEKKGWTICDEELSDKLQRLKIRLCDTADAIDKLKNELSFQQECTSRLEEVINSMDSEAEVMKFTKAKSDEEIVDLKKQIALLSSIAYNGDQTKEVKKTSQLSSKLSFRHIYFGVDLPDEKEYRITGLAIIDNELLITSISNVVTVNDLRTLKFKRRWRVEKMHTVVDMKASVCDKCIYLLCGLTHVDLHSCPVAHLLRCNTKGLIVRQWNPDAGNLYYAQISVTDKSNVLVTNGSVNKFTEYSPDGVVIRVVSLKWESGIENLRHVIKLTSDHFLICHGRDEDSLHRVCIIDFDGNVLKHYGDIRKTEKLNDPIYLEMTADGNVLVADHLNQCLLLLNSSLKYMKQLMLYNPGELCSLIDRRPRKMIQDESNGRMLVVENIWKASAEGKPKNMQYGDQLSVFIFSMQ